MSNDWLPPSDAKKFSVQTVYVEPLLTGTVKTGTLQDKQEIMRHFFCLQKQEDQDSCCW